KLAVQDGGCRYNLPSASRKAINGQCSRSGQRSDSHREQAVRWRVVGIAEAEVRHFERVGCVLGRGHRVIGATRSVVHRRDIDRERVWSWIEVDSPIGRAAVVLYLERKACVR